VASAVAVELAGRHLDARDAQRILIPWAAALLEKQAPDERERAWFLAANALIQRTYDPFFWPRFGRGLKGWDFPGHAIARFPKEDRFHLARVLDLELASWRTVQMQQQMQQMQQQMKLSFSGISWRDTLRELAVAFEKLLPRASIGADVHLRLGHTYLRLERFDEALQLLTRVESRTNDPFLIYLSRYLTGRARRAMGDLPGAAGAFRSALDAVPHAQSAALALASLTLAGDDPAGAYALVHAAVARATNVNDPWRQYQEAEFRLWHSSVAALRQEVR
jgi:tetratricopeptide (TPR) repeat protein